MNRILAFTFIFLWLLANYCKADNLSKIRWATNDNGVRIVVEVPKECSFKAFTLTNPNRIVLDLSSIKWEDLNNFKKLFSNSFIKNIRHGIRNTDDLRIVFDTTALPISISTSHLPIQENIGFRIIIDASFDLSTVENEILNNDTQTDKIETEKISKDSIITSQNKSKKSNPNDQNAFSILDNPNTSISSKFKSKNIEKNKAIVNSTKAKETFQEKIEPSNNVDTKDKDVKIIFTPEALSSDIIDNKVKLEEDLEDSKVTKNKENAKEALQKLMKLRESSSPVQIKEKKLTIPRRLYTIVIDPGHGGIDRGATGKYFGTLEKELTLDYAKSLKESLEQYGKYKVILTRNTDRGMSIMARRNKARIHKADIFISLHADSNPDPLMQGASIYTLSDKAYDLESEDLSKRENTEELANTLDLKNENKDIANLLIDLVRRDTKNISAKFAALATKELSKEVKLIKDAHRFAGFKVLKGVDIPAILIELGYLSNKKEEALLKSSNYRKKIIKALTVAINKHFDKNKRR